jgi:uncharacterized protein YecT (DUF1311 family)
LSYLDAARQRIAREDNDKPQLDAVQDAWLHYRSLQCGGVYADCEAGSVRIAPGWNALNNASPPMPVCVESHTHLQHAKQATLD